MERRSVLLASAAGLASLALDVDSSAQGVPEPIYLPVPNIPQEMPVWCWAAVAQQVIRYYAWGSPLQCELVAAASNAPPIGCCGAPHTCNRTGALQEIQALLLRFGGKPSAITEPGAPIQLYNVLRTQTPVIAHLQAGYGMGHVVVLRGIRLTPVPIVFANDPMSIFTQPVRFDLLRQYWASAIVPM